MHSREDSKWSLLSRASAMMVQPVQPFRIFGPPRAGASLRDRQPPKIVMVPSDGPSLPSVAKPCQAATCHIRMYARGAVFGSSSVLCPGGIIARISRGRRRCGSNGLTVFAIDEILDGTRSHGHGRSHLSKHVPSARISHRPGSWLILLQTSPGPSPATVRCAPLGDRRNLQLHWSG